METPCAPTGVPGSLGRENLIALPLCFDAHTRTGQERLHTVSGIVRIARIKDNLPL